ncbi:TonB-dependent receptor domain-containing protein [Pontibacter harenae]|uniref:TonB-dependent receptor domain-containing protein n=1 Tax=Pontibacter harenae TaxID=2894083 RepID=UPI001E579C2E|nr:TonB-dependent receptor [Pontibacter harenae]MCC9165479.1 TonB-dependent receptor [Pontibacter harenae]
MKNLYHFLLSIIFLSVSMQAASAQSDPMLTGIIVDDKAQGVGFANIAVLDASTKNVVTGTIADIDGKFELKALPKGNYLLSLTGLGYLPTQTEAFVVDDLSFKKDFGKLMLMPDVKTLKEVTVQTMRPTIVNEADKMVVSVEGTALASGSTAFEVLAKSPGVWVDQDGNIQLNGKAGVQVMINGRPSYLSGKDLQNLLQGMSAENLKDLEIITNPSSKYDAEGASGIININLKKNTLFGMNGSAYAGYQYNKLSSYNAGADISHKKGKWNSFGNLDMAKRMNYRDMTMDRILNVDNGKVYLEQESYEEVERYTPSLRLGTDYDINDKHSIGAVARLSYTDYNNFFLTDSYLRDGNAANDLYIDANNASESATTNGTFNLHYTGKLDTVGTTLSADLDYAQVNSKEHYNFLNTIDSLGNNAPTQRMLLKSNNPNRYSIYAAKTDFTTAVGKKSKLEVGLKASYVVSDNELRFYKSSDGIDVLDPTRSNHFIYKENIYAAYTSFSTKFGENWSLKAGLRAEQTESRGRSVTLNQETKRSYLDLFPTFFLQQKVSDNYQLSYKYSRRINRPYYESLNPFIFFLDPYTWSQGNPYLRPQYTNNFEVTQTIKQSYNLVLGYAVTKGFMAEVPTYNSEDNTTVFQQQNVDEMINASATLVAPVSISDKWQMNNTVTSYYQKFTKVIDDQPVLNEQFAVVAQSNQNIQLPHGIKMEVNAGYQSPTVYGLYTVGDQWWVDAGFKKSFMNDKLDLTLNFTDIFRSRLLFVETVLDGNVNSINQYQGAQGVRLNLRYRFSKGKEFTTKKRNVNLEELDRTGN